MQKKNINSLKDLQREQEKLRASLELSRERTVKQFGTTKKELSRFLLTKVALPAGALGVTAFGISKMRGNAKEKLQVASEKTLLAHLTPIILQLVKMSSKLLK